MRKIFGIGETVLDIIIRNGKAEAANPGGSTFNSMISLGRCGAEAVFMSEYGDDRAGRMITEFMNANGVDSTYVDLLPVKTTIALAFLNEKNDAEYMFYSEAPSKRPAQRLPEIEPDDLVLFGSFFALNPDLRPRVRAFLDYARSRGAIIYYDINFRPSHLKDLERCGNALWENIEIADIVRGSNEDFHTLFGLDDVDAVFHGMLAEHCERLIYTCGAEPLKVRDYMGAALEFPVKKIKTVSTVGAGDNFNAGFLFGILREGITREDIVTGLSEEQWGKLISCANSFSLDCCQSTENYVSKAFAKSMAADYSLL
ncbi:MAG: carbohydrate kinase [Bacteroidales bacterium]|nr:carbohydrate kinase [Bacteroidales bacterium]